MNKAVHPIPDEIVGNANKLGINVSLYHLLPLKYRLKALLKDVKNSETEDGNGTKKSAGAD